MGGKTLKDRIENESIWVNWGRTNRYKMRETRLRRFGHVHRRSIDATVKRIDCSELTGISLGDEELIELG